MKIVSISDTHIRSEGDFCEQALFDFLSHETTKSADIVVLNGDIFDYASGFHPAYWKRFERFFSCVKRIILSSQKLVFIEGNHDIHLERVFRRFIQKINGNQKLFTYVTKSIILNSNDQKIYFSHGDEIPGSKLEYIKYKNIIRSRPIQIIANLFPLRFFDYLAVKASGDSRKRSSKYDESQTKNFYAQAVLQLKKENPDVETFVLGHSHLKEDSLYFNTGFTPNTRKFYFFDGRSSQLKDF